MMNYQKHKEKRKKLIVVGGAQQHGAQIEKE
jgi:hypothetical protein